MSEIETRFQNRGTFAVGDPIVTVIGGAFGRSGLGTWNWWQSRGTRFGAIRNDSLTP